VWGEGSGSVGSVGVESVGSVGVESVGNVECGEWGVWGVWSVECGLWGVGVWGVECGEWEWGVWSVGDGCESVQNRVVRGTYTRFSFSSFLYNNLPLSTTTESGFTPISLSLFSLLPLRDTDVPYCYTMFCAGKNYMEMLAETRVFSC
jgi:hypothetical protein